MFCRNCGKEINDQAEICIHCGTRPLIKRNFCYKCGAETKPNQEICIKCGFISMSSTLYTKEQIPYRTEFSNLSQYYQDEFNKIYSSGDRYRGKWNWWAFSFGALWGLTKGVWLASVIAIIVVVFAGLIVAPLGWIIATIYWFIFGVRGNWMYYNAYAKKKQLPI